MSVRTFTACVWRQLWCSHVTHCKAHGKLAALFAFEAVIVTCIKCGKSWELNPA